jgi:hypothetical protein
LTCEFHVTSMLVVSDSFVNSPTVRSSWAVAVGKSVKCTGVRSNVIRGNPDPDHVSTSYIERQDLTMRMSMRRFTRLTNVATGQLGPTFHRNHRSPGPTPDGCNERVSAGHWRDVVEPRHATALASSGTEPSATAPPEGARVPGDSGDPGAPRVRW